MDKVRVGFVGCGFMGQLAHIANYFQLENCELVAVADGRQQLAHLVAERYGIKKVYKDHLELAHDKDVEAVAAIMGYGILYPVVKDLLLAGKHVITEKPMAYLVEEAQELVEIAQNKNLIYQVGYMKRHDKGINAAKKYIDEFKASKEFGEIKFVRCWCFGGDWTYGIEMPIATDEKIPPYNISGKERPEWLSDKSSSDDQPDRNAKVEWFYNRLLNIDSHLTNIVRYLIDEDFSPLNISYDGETTFVLTAMSEKNRILCVFEGGEFPSRKWQEGIQVYFKNALINISPASPMHKQSYADVEISKTGKTIKEIIIPKFAPEWAFLRQAKHFLDSVRGISAPVSPASEAVKEIIFAENCMKLL